MRIFRTYRVLGLVVAGFFSLITTRESAAATQADIEQCLQNGLGRVLSGQVAARHYMNLPGVVSRVFGPPARQLDDAGYQNAAAFIGKEIQAYINKKRQEFSSPLIAVTGLKSRSGHPNVYGVTGTINVDGTTYDLVVNGYFYSAQKCAVYGVSIARTWSLVQYLRDLPRVRQRCEELTKMRC